MTEYNVIDGSDAFYTGEPVEQLPPYIVYVKTDENNLIAAVNSSAFLTDANGWVEIDSGYGDKYHHAQGNYFAKPIYDERGICRYKLADGKPVERTQTEMDADYVPHVPPVDPKELEIQELKQQVAALSAALLNL